MVLEFLNKLVFTVFKAIIDFISKFILEPIITFVIQFIVGMTSYYLYQVAVLLLSVIDLISDFFQMLAGIEMANGSYISFGDDLVNAFTGRAANTSGGDMLFQLITSEPVLQTFTSVAVVGAFLTILSTLIMIVKQEFNADKPNAKGPIIASALKSFIYMMFVPVICIFGVFVSNMVLNLLHTATAGDGDVTVSGVVFTSSAYNAVYRLGEVWVSMDDPISGAIASGMNGMIQSIAGNFGIKAEDLEASALEINGAVDKKDLMDKYIYISKHKDPLGAQSRLQIIFYIDGSAISVAKPIDAAKMLEKYGAEIDPNNYATVESLNKFFIEQELNDGKFIKYDTKADAKAASKKDGGDDKVAVYWSSLEFRAYFNSIQVSRDFNMSRVNYVSLFASAIIIIKAMAQACAGLIMRLYKAIAFFLILPGVLGLSPLDGGASFSSWKKTFIGEVIAAYGFVLAVNIYLFLTPLVVSLNISYKPTNAPSGFVGTSSASVSAMAMIGQGMAEGVIRMIFMIAGALMIEKLASMISGFIGGVDIASIGKGMVGDIGKTMATGALIGGGLAMGGLATTALLYGAIGDKLQTGVKGSGTAFKDSFKKQMAGKKGIGKLGGAIAGTVTGSLGAVKQTTSNVAGGVKAIPSKIAGKAKAIKEDGVHGALLNVAAPFSKTAQSMKYARSNYLESKGKFEDSDEKLKLAQANYDEAVKGGDAKAISSAEEELHKAQAENQGLAQKYIDDANKYAGTAAVLRDGNLETAKAAGLYAMSTVLDNLPGADIAKGLWGSRKDAAKDVDNSSEYNKDRAESLNKASKDLRDKLVGMADPVGRAHNNRGYDLNAASMMADIQEKVEQSQRTKLDQLRRIKKRLENAGDDAAQKARIMAQASDLRLTLPDAEGNQKLITEEHLQCYSDVKIEIEKLRNKAGTDTNKIMRGFEDILKKYAETTAKPLYKDIEDIIKQIRDSR